MVNQSNSLKYESQRDDLVILRELVVSYFIIIEWKFIDVNLLIRIY